VSGCIDEHRERFVVEPICRTSVVSASAHYQQRTGKRSARPFSRRLRETARG
jgi:putative transposase